MNFWRWSLFAILVLVLCFSIILACGDDDDDDDDDTTGDDEDDDDVADDDDDDSAGCGIEDICAYLFSDDCPDHLGMTSEENCNDKWSDGCGNVDEYLPCACACLAAGPTDCNDWQENCEEGCWADYCE